MYCKVALYPNQEQEGFLEEKIEELLSAFELMSFYSFHRSEGGLYDTTKLPPLVQ